MISVSYYSNLLFFLLNVQISYYLTLLLSWVRNNMNVWFEHDIISMFGFIVKILIFVAICRWLNCWWKYHILPRHMPPTLTATTWGCGSRLLIMSAETWGFIGKVSSADKKRGGQKWNRHLELPAPPVKCHLFAETKKTKNADVLDLCLFLLVIETYRLGGLHNFECNLSLSLTHKCNDN